MLVRDGGNADRLHQVDRALAYTERTLGTLQDLRSVADVLLKVGEAVPIFGPACKVARDILTEVSESADKVDDVLEAGRRVVDTLKVINILNENLSRLGGAERAELESVMRGLESLLQDMKEVLQSFRSRGWLKRVIQLGKHAKTLKRLDRLIRDKMELAMSLYRFAQDAAASATQQQLLQLLQERSYALEEAVAEKVDERVRVERMTEEAAIADLENDAYALSDVARTARISEQALLDEFRSFGAEVCKQYDHVQESLMKINAAVEALRQRPANGFDLYEYVRKLNVKPGSSDKLAATLGRGAFGTTYRMRKREGIAQLLVAVKVINEDLFDSEDTDEKDFGISAEKLEREAVQLSLIRHPNIVQYIEAFWHESADEGRQFVIVTELLTGGSFKSKTIQRPPPTEEILAAWFGQIASGLAYLHDERMLHRDLKPENVLFDYRDRAKIIDLGLACTVDSKSCGKTRTGGSSGTNLFMSPEKCWGVGRDSKEDDIWALGCLLAAGLLGDPLLGAAGKFNFAVHRPNIEKLIGDSCLKSKRLGSFVRAMLEQDPQRRPKAHQVVQRLLVQELSGGGKGETDEVARLKEQLAQATAAKEAMERDAAERFAAAEKASAEKAAAMERDAAADVKAAAEEVTAEKDAAEQVVQDAFPADLEVRMTAETALLELEFKSKFLATISFTPYPELFELLSIPMVACTTVMFADNCARELTDLTKKLIDALPNSDKYQFALARSLLISIKWEDKKITFGETFSLDQWGLKALSDKVNLDAEQGGGIPVSVAMEVRWCPVHMPSKPLIKLGGGPIQAWYEKDMQFTNGLLVWNSSSYLQKREEILLDGTPISLPGDRKEISFVKKHSGETKRLRGKACDIDSLVEAYNNRMAMKDYAEKADARHATAMANFCRKAVIRDEQSVRRVTSLNCRYKQLNDDDCEVIAYLIASGALANLTELYLSYNQIGNEGIKAFSSALASGALANLTVLVLDTNQIGDEGIKTFSSALASGALVNLTELGLDGNKIGDDGIKVFSETVASGALANLTRLDLENNQIGDEGMKALSSALASGALVNLVELYLSNNQIGDEGIKIFSSALASGALANLTVLALNKNQISDEGIKTFSSALASGTMAKLTDLRLYNNQIGDEGIKVFSSVLASGALAKLTELWIDIEHKTKPCLVAACKPRGINTSVG